MLQIKIIIIIIIIIIYSNFDSFLWRVQAGYCFHLFTEFHFNEMKDYQLPEMLRTPLEELCLQIKVRFELRPQQRTFNN